MKKAPPILVNATSEQLEAAKARLLAGALGGAIQAGATLDKLVPGFRPVVDALPDLRPSLALAPEVRVMFVTALYQAGVQIPESVWRELRLSHYRDLVMSTVVKA